MKAEISWNLRKDYRSINNTNVLEYHSKSQIRGFFSNPWKKWYARGLIWIYYSRGWLLWIPLHDCGLSKRTKTFRSCMIRSLNLSTDGVLTPRTGKNAVSICILSSRASDIVVPRLALPNASRLSIHRSSWSPAWLWMYKSAAEQTKRYFRLSKTSLSKFQDLAIIHRNFQEGILENFHNPETKTALQTVQHVSFSGTLKGWPNRCPQSEKRCPWSDLGWSTADC